MSDWIRISTEEIYTRLARRPAPSERWPLAGIKVNSIEHELMLDQNHELFLHRAKELCRLIETADKKHRPAMISTINKVLGFSASKRITTEMIGNAADQIMAAVKAKYPDSTSPFRDFAHDLHQQSELESPLHTFTLPLPHRITIEGTSQDYLVVNGYLIPYYPVDKIKDDGADKPELDLFRRNEALIISRARNFIGNAQPELGIPHTRVQIEEQLGKLRDMPERTRDECGLKFGRFKAIAGEIITRLDTLGRVILQGNTEGTVIEYDELKHKAAIPKDLEPILKKELGLSPITAGRLRAEFGQHLRATTPLTAEQIDAAIRSFQPSGRLQKILSDQPMNALMSHTISPQTLNRLREEYIGYCRLLSEPSMESLLHGMLLTDKRPDTDGILIDFFREIRKPILYLDAEKEGEAFVRGNIMNKIGYAMESIDRIHRTLHELLAHNPIAKELFAHSVKEFLAAQPEDSSIKTVDDIMANIERYASLCKARACTQAKDSTYIDIFMQKDPLSAFFEGPNGLLQSMRRVGRGTGTIEIQQLRDIISRSLKLMERTGYTRTPCDDRAPEPWIPNLSDEAPPMEKYLAGELLSKSDRARAERKFVEAKYVSDPSNREAFLRNQFSSLGILRSDVAKFERELELQPPLEGFGDRLGNWLDRLVKTQPHREGPLSEQRPRRR
jgi:hypothetical protein